MARGLIERLVYGMLLLLGVDATAHWEVAVLVVLVVATLVEYALTRRTGSAKLGAILRALELPSHTRPLDDAKLLEQLRKAGISPKAVAEAWHRERKPATSRARPRRAAGPSATGG
jgi:hypothetical protein